MGPRKCALLALLALASSACAGAAQAPAAPSSEPSGGGGGVGASASAREEPATPRMGGEIRHFEKNKDFLRVDRVGEKDGAFTPDGVLDHVYDLELDGPATAIFLTSTDARGESNGEFTADTLVGTDMAPPEVASMAGMGKHTAGIAVFEGGARRNADDGRLLPLKPGRHGLELHVSSKDLPRSGSMRVFVRFSDDSVVKGPHVPLK